MYTAQATVQNETGLHARPAAQFVKKAAQFQSNIQLTNLLSGKSCTAKSIILVMKLAVACGTPVEIRAEGADEREAADALAALIGDGFGEL